MSDDDLLYYIQACGLIRPGELVRAVTRDHYPKSEVRESLRRLTDCGRVGLDWHGQLIATGR